MNEPEIGNDTERAEAIRQSAFRFTEIFASRSDETEELPDLSAWFILFRQTPQFRSHCEQSGKGPQPNPVKILEYNMVAQPLETTS